MGVKLKPSTKEYVRDSKGKIIPNKWVLRHHTPSGTSTEELKKLYESPSQKKNKNKIKRELIKRGIIKD